MADFRIERDSMGELKVPAAALWGAQTQRAVANFPISGLTMPRQFIRALGLIKSAAAQANADLGHLSKAKAKAVRKQAERVTQWLLQRLPARFALIASPAVRAQQTAEALGLPVKTDKTLAPGASPAAILRACGWPDYKTAAVIVGHQPDFGRAVGELIGSRGGASIKKGGLWWLSNRVRDEADQVVVRAVVSPDLL